MMKFKFLFQIFFFLVFISGPCVYSQVAPVIVTRSNEKVVIEGKVYFIHIVKKGETLFSISKAYSVTQEDIISENPTAKLGLQINQALKIPFIPEPEELPSIDYGQYIIHRVEQGQTLFFLSQLYKVEIAEIIAINPGADVVLRIGDGIRIPKRNIMPQGEVVAQVDDKFYRHKVLQGETLFSISQRYNVPVREIRKANKMSFWGIKAGEYILIPKDIGFIADKQKEHTKFPADTVYFRQPVSDIPDYLDVIADPACLEFNYSQHGRPYNVALFLPLFLERNFPRITNDGISVTNQQRLPVVSPEILPATIPYLEFYQGALIAVDSLKKLGLSINLHIWDTERNNSRIREIIHSNEFKDIDLIVGPFFTEEIAIVSDFARQRNLPVISPVSTRHEIIENNPYLYQVTPSIVSELEHGAGFLSNFPYSNFVIIHNNEPDEIIRVQRLTKNLDRNLLIKDSLNKPLIREVLYDENIVANLGKVLVKENENFVIIVSNDQGLISDLLNRLNIFSKSYPLRVLGMFEWQSFTNLDVEFFHNIQFHYAAPFYINFNSPEVKQFLWSFRNRFKSEPGNYGFLGFDIFYYFLSALKSFGTDFKNCLPHLKVNLTQSNFNFRRINDTGGFENQGFSVIRYNKDYTVVELKNTNDSLKIVRQHYSP